MGAWAIAQLAKKPVAARHAVHKLGCALIERASVSGGSALS
jgi:LacI family transcriptional regulator